jgi:SusD family.
MEKHEDRLDTRTYSLVRGEALALRALVHFDLMRVYGPVPAAPDASVAYLPYVTDNHYMAYTYETYDRFMELMFMDMDEAERLLKEYDPVITMSWDETEIENYTWHYRKSRLNYYGVLGLQARMHLWMGGDTHKSEALRYANLVKDAMEPDGATPKFRLTVAADIESGAQYSDDRYYYFEHLAGVLCDNFDYLNDGDIIWKSGSLTSNHPTFATLMVNGNTSDLRYKVGVESTYISTPRPGRYVYAMKKGKSFHAASNASKNFPIIRFAEIYFILMELNSLSEANILYQEYCDTRDITYVPMTDETRAETLLHESIREFFGEGQNFFTYKRNRVRNIWFTDNECSDEMYRVPIPTAELLSTDLTIE